MIVEAIAKYIKENEIKQVFLCEKTGLTRYRIRMIQNGKSRLSIEEYEKICAALNLPYEYFFLKCKEDVT